MKGKCYCMDCGREINHVGRCLVCQKKAKEKKEAQKKYMYPLKSFKEFEFYSELEMVRQIVEWAGHQSESWCDEHTFLEIAREWTLEQWKSH